MRPNPNARTTVLTTLLSDKAQSAIKMYAFENCLTEFDALNEMLENCAELFIDSVIMEKYQELDARLDARIAKISEDKINNN